VIEGGQSGLCRVRTIRDGKPELPFYGFITALAMDPIEKKPLYHFRPGSRIMSAGFAGCNLRCPFCQNWHISQTTAVTGRYVSPKELIAAVQAENGTAIAYTYSEPLVHMEFLLECMKLARKAGIANVLVSNGCANAAPACAVLELCDAANIDLKCFSAQTYRTVLGGDLETVLAFIRLAHKKGVHLELTTLVVPGLNDTAAELDSCSDFIAGVSRDIPWHLSAYHPDYQWDAPPTDPSMLAETARRARQKLRYVYAGNVAGESNDTKCPGCGALLIRRRNYSIDSGGLTLKSPEGKQQYYCAQCGNPAPVAF
jgi:pyruvate formate lyase activating enzyme